MNISKELLEKAANCKTPEELVTLAKDNGVELTLEKADELLKQNSKKPLTDDEIDAVAGGEFYRYVMTDSDKSSGK